MSNANNFHSFGVRIRRRLIVATILPLLILGLLATLLSAYALWKISLPLIMQSATSRAQVIAADASENMNNLYLRPLDIAAASLAQYSEVQEQRQALNSFSAFLLKRFEGGVMLLDTNGIITAATSGLESRIGEQYIGEEYIRTVKSFRRTVFSGVIKDEQLGQNAVVIATPVLFEDRLSGVLVGVFLLNNHTWERDLGPTYRNFKGDVILLDVSGNIIYHPEQRQRGTNIRSSEVLWDLVALREPRSILLQNALFGDQLVASFAPLPGTYWGLITEESFNVITPAFPYQVRVIGPLLAVMLIFIILLLAAVERVSHPLIALLQEAACLSSGNPLGQLEVEGPLELQTLITTFNQLVSRLNEQRAALYEYAKQVLKSQEEERRRLSRELHDETIQSLVSLSQRLELTRYALDQDSEAARTRLNELQVLAQQAVSDVRRMSNDLRPAILEDLGLAAALGALCDEISQQIPGINVEYEHTGEIRRLKSEHELTIFRVTQEALHNIRKHAQTATLVKVAIQFDKQLIRVTIIDNGPGFYLTELHALVREGHLGLVGMYERAHMFGGLINIQTVPGKGTKITLELDAE